MTPRQRIFDIAHGNIWDVEQNFHESFAQGLLEIWFPNIRLLDGCDQGNRIHLEGDALLHTGLVFAHAAFEKNLTESNRFVLLVAAAVYDVCNPQTRRIREDKVTFYGHAEMAAPLCPSFAKNVGMDAIEAERLEWVVLRHMQAHDLPKFGAVKRLRFYQTSHFPVLAALQAADARGVWKNQDGSLHMEVLADFFAQDYEKLSAAVI